MTTALSQLIIQKDAIAYNLRQLQNHLPQKPLIIGVVKADGYGTGALSLVKTLKELGMTYFSVATISEAVALRKGGIQDPILTFYCGPHQAKIAVEHQLNVAVSNLSEIEALEAASTPSKTKVHLHINTGMSRLGCSLKEALPLAQKIASSPSLELEGLMSHYSSIDEPEQDTFSLLQTTRFMKAIDAIREAGIDFKYTHISNSAGAVRLPNSIFNAVRVGLQLLGVPQVDSKLDYKPALTFQSQLVQVHTLGMGEPVSYNRHYRAPRDGTRIGVVPVGYYDGIKREFRDRGQVQVAGKKAKICGTICMDFLMIDITDLPAIKEGDPVTFFGFDESGKWVDAVEFAKEGQTIAHELFSGIGPRVERRWI